jgi:EAL domain-containing protein (putative c-di-GMP-specific phosphodiesterase class I)
MSEDAPRVLLVDDNTKLLRALARLLSADGYRTETATDGSAALEIMRTASFDAVVSDIKMPGLTGIEFLRAVRDFDLDVPVILMTGAPEVETATAAVEFGAFRYLCKPIETGELEATVRRAVLMHGLARLKRQALDALGAEGMRVSDLAALENRFTKALSHMWMVYQPIVSVERGTVYAYEALVRSDEPTLPNPTALIDAAERLGRLPDLGRAVRRSVSEILPSIPADVLAFVNLHPDDLLDDDLYDSTAWLSRFAPRVVLEVTERASLDGIHDLVERMASLRRMGYRVAVDDLGAGYAGLSSLARLEPNVLKLDMSLVRDVHTSPVKRQLVYSMSRLARELGVQAIAEGVENAEEMETLASLGLDLIQGFHVARPQRWLGVPTMAPRPIDNGKSTPS